MDARKNILALDVATVTGWAWTDGERIEHGVWDLRVSGTARSGKKLEQLENQIYWMIEHYPIDVIAHEDLSVGSKGFSAAYFRGQCGGILELAASKNEIVVLPCHISSVKLFATGNGAAKKPEMIHAARCKLGIDVTSPDEADALWVLHYAMAEVSERVKHVKKRRECRPKPERKLF